MVDIRIIKTKENIVDAFFLILEWENYQDMTVEQICQYARCSRSTFYSYYSNKEDVLKQIVDRYMTRFNQYIKNRFSKITDFENLLSKLITELIFPERKNIHKIIHIESNNYGLSIKFEVFCKDVFISYYSDIPSKNILGELYGTCAVVILKNIVDGQFNKNDIKVINELQQSLFNSPIFKSQYH
ncbi:TetR/AcrR family transcriptional regulator [Enterococcus gilvus]|uniref:TetR/AcrR family transcriptional regulator n=1 Tax=Enterococcus gilvus TaxID=160453 RepID=UPI0028D1C65A|nr:TetR/AcrR family transcriptional regulator [Enterococcus gilvus]